MRSKPQMEYRKVALMPSIIILAAGMGRRFGSGEHKCLSPLFLGEGTLLRLLRQLTAIVPQADITVVTGHESDAISYRCKSIFPNLNIAHNFYYADGSALRSICAGLRSLKDRREAQGVWVFFGDTVYKTSALTDIFQTATPDITLACMPTDAEASDRIGVAFERETKALLCIGPHVRSDQGIMVPAVYWPKWTWLHILDADEKGLTLQWQVLRHLAPGRANVVPLRPHQVSDVDTRADLRHRRTEILGQSTINYFRFNISKEERNRHTPDLVSNDIYIKRCADDEQASIEYSALSWLADQPGEKLGPNPVARDGRNIALEYVPGIRLYDLLRLLKRLASQERDCTASANEASSILMRRSYARLGRIQRALLAWAAGRKLAAYPFETHVADLLSRLLSLLELPGFSSAGMEELRDLSEMWAANDAMIPFRDATPKNIMVAIPELAPRGREELVDRQDTLRRWLERGEAENVCLVDYDFTSTRHLTAPEDDGISLLAHQGSLHVGGHVLSGQNNSWIAAIQDLPETLGLVANPARAARALLVRYLRFGGRKIMYRMINPSGYAVRFRHDSPEHYFQTIPVALDSLDEGFAGRWPEVYSRLRAIDMAVSRLPTWSSAEANHDHYVESDGADLRFWRESPVE